MEIELYNGSIFDVKADVIVNPANVFLMHGGGLARLIHDIAGGYDDHGQNIHPWTLQEQRERVIAYREFEAQGNRVPTGDCIISPPGLLNFKAIAHAVGPIWKDGTLYEAELLRAAYSSVLSQALYYHNYKSIVFPAISAGIFGAPIHDVAHAAALALKSWNYDELDDLTVTIALTDEYHMDVFESIFKDEGLV